MKTLEIKKKFRRFRFFKGKPLLVYRTARGFFNSMILRRDVLRSVEFAVLYQCNLHCDKCYARKLYNPKTDRMPVEDIKKIWKQCYDLGAIHVNITGGEPLLRNDIIDVVKAFRPRETMISLVTNGILFTRDIAFELKKAGLTSIHFSLDSYKAEIHDKYRNYKGLYDKLMKGIEYAHEADLIICLSTVISPDTIEDMPKLLKLAKEKKCFLLICPSAAIGGWENRNDKLLNKEQIERLDKFRISNSHTTQDLEFNYRGYAHCPAGTEKIYITPQGDVYPCVYIHKYFGNVYKEPLKDIYKRISNYPEFKKRCKVCLRYEKIYNS